MKTSTILTTTSLIALLSSFGLMACGGSEVEPQDQSQSASLAQSGARTPAPQALQPEAGADHRGPGGHRFGPPSPDKFIERFDTNKDGVLQAAELPERMQQNIGEIDTSGDGVVTKDELVARFAAKRAEFEQHAKARFDKKDANHDGALDQSEVGAEHWAKLSVADANGDGKLTPDELKTAFESGKIKPMMMRGEHGRRWQHGDSDQAPAAPVAPAAPAAPAPAL
jgi:hypothetical protein